MNVYVILYIEKYYCNILWNYSFEAINIKKQNIPAKVICAITKLCCVGQPFGYFIQ